MCHGYVFLFIQETDTVVGKDKCLPKKKHEDPNHLSGGGWSFLILEPNIIVVYTSKFDSASAGTISTHQTPQKSGQISNKNTWKTTPTHKNQVHTPRNLKMAGWKPSYTKASPHLFQLRSSRSSGRHSSKASRPKWGFTSSSTMGEPRSLGA